MNQWNVKLFKLITSPLAKLVKKQLCYKVNKKMYDECRTYEKFEKFRTQCNHCANIRQHVISDYFTKICKGGIMDSKTFGKNQNLISFARLTATQIL